jgi:putative tryptophan/tyrosine transport system substrate-binding protein
MSRPLRCRPSRDTVLPDVRARAGRGHRLRRRHLFFCLVGVAAVRPASVGAQQRKVPTIGVLAVGAPGWEEFWRLFRESMRELGYVDGQSVRYEFRSDQGQTSRLPELAAELVRLPVDLIVTWYTPAAQAAKQATGDIPIVMALAGNPVETGLVESLDRPGGNITGMAGAAAELASKAVELTEEMLPSARRFVALANALDPFSKPFVEYIRKGGAAIGVAIDAKMIRDADELEAAFRDLAQDRPDAVIVQPSLPRRRVAELAMRHRIPAVSVIRGFADEGGLMSYAPSEAEIYRRSAAMVDKILKGAKPSRIPVEQPTKFELLVNLKTAKALGLALSPIFVARADVVIE